MMTKFLFLYKLFFFAEIKVSVFCLICFIFWAHPSENVSLFTEASSTIDNQSICPSCFLPEPSVLLLELKHLFSACFSGGYAQLCFSGAPEARQVTRVRAILAQWSGIYSFYSEKIYYVLSRCQRIPMPEAGDPEVNLIWSLSPKGSEPSGVVNKWWMGQRGALGVFCGGLVRKRI